MLDTNVTLDTAGRILIPAGIRKALGLNTRSRLILRLRNDRLELVTVAGAVEKAQELVRRHVPAKRKLAEDLIRSRRKEAASE